MMELKKVDWNYVGKYPDMVDYVLDDAKRLMEEIDKGVLLVRKKALSIINILKK